MSKNKTSAIPIPSMYGIYTYIWLIFMVNVGKYTNPMDAMGLGPWAQKVPLHVREAPEVFCRECWRQYLEQAVQEGRGTFLGWQICQFFGAQIWNWTLLHVELMRKSNQHMLAYVVFDVCFGHGDHGFLNWIYVRVSMFLPETNSLHLKQFGGHPKKLISSSRWWF